MIAQLTESYNQIFEGDRKLLNQNRDKLKKEQSIKQQMLNRRKFAIENASMFKKGRKPLVQILRE